MPLAADSPASAHRHFVLHKPWGYLSQFTSEFAKEVKKKRFLGELGDFPAGTMAIGRLDEDSEGLLLLTTDGRVSEQVRGRHVEKEYWFSDKSRELKQMQLKFAGAYS